MIFIKKWKIQKKTSKLNQIVKIINIYKTKHVQNSSGFKLQWQYKVSMHFMHRQMLSIQQNPLFLVSIKFVHPLPFCVCELIVKHG